MLPGFICMGQNFVFLKGKCKWGFLSKAESMGMLLKLNYFRIKKNPSSCREYRCPALAVVHSKRDSALQESNFHTWPSAFRWDLDFKLSNVDPVRMSTEAVPCPPARVGCPIQWLRKIRTRSQRTPEYHFQFPH